MLFTVKGPMVRNTLVLRTYDVIVRTSLSSPEPRTPTTRSQKQKKNTTVVVIDHEEIEPALLLC